MYFEAEFVITKNVKKLCIIRVPGPAEDVCESFAKKIRAFEQVFLEIWTSQVSVLILCLFVF